MNEAKGLADIKPEGVGGHEVKPDDKFEGNLANRRIAGAASLGDLAKDFVFFTPGLLFTHGELTQDPVQEWMNEATGDPQIALMHFDKPVFEGFRFKDGRRDWNHKLLAVERGRAEALLRFVGEVGILDTPQKTFCRAFPFSVIIPDPVVMDRAAVVPVPVPTVEVVVFGLDGNTRRVLVQAPKVLGVGHPRVVIERPDERTVRFAAKLLAGQDPAESPDPTTADVFRQAQKEQTG